MHAAIVRTTSTASTRPVALLTREAPVAPCRQVVTHAAGAAASIALHIDSATTAHCSDVGRSRLTVIFGTNVRRIRLAKGLSQEDLAHQVGVHRSFIGALERGERNPTLVSVERVADALGTDAADLLRDVGTRGSSSG